jgi:hypothetical protein
MSKDLKPEIIVMALRMPDDADINPLQVKSLFSSLESRLLAISVWHDEENNQLAESFGAVTLIDKMGLARRLLPTIAQLASTKHSSRGVVRSLRLSCY